MTVADVSESSQAMGAVKISLLRLRLSLPTEEDVMKESRETRRGWWFHSSFKLWDATSLVLSANRHPRRKGFHFPRRKDIYRFLLEVLEVYMKNPTPSSWAYLSFQNKVLPWARGGSEPRTQWSSLLGPTSAYASPDPWHSLRCGSTDGDSSTEKHSRTFAVCSTLTGMMLKTMHLLLMCNVRHPV